MISKNVNKSCLIKEPILLAKEGLSGIA